MAATSGLSGATTDSDGGGWEKVPVSNEPVPPEPGRKPSQADRNASAPVRSHDQGSPRVREAEGRTGGDLGWAKAVRFDIVTAGLVRMVKCGEKDTSRGEFKELCKVAMPVVTFPGGPVGRDLRPCADDAPGVSIEVKMTCPTQGALIVYTTDSSEPCYTSAKYDHHKGLRWRMHNTVFNVRAIKDGMDHSDLLTVPCPLTTDPIAFACATLPLSAGRVLRRMEARRLELERRIRELELEDQRLDIAEPLPVESLDESGVPERPRQNSVKEFVEELSKTPAARRAAVVAVLAIYVSVRGSAAPPEVWKRHVTEECDYAVFQYVEVQQPSGPVRAFELGIATKLDELLAEEHERARGAVQGKSWIEVPGTAQDARPRVHVLFYSDPWHSRRIMMRIEKELGIGISHGALSMQDVPMVRWAAREKGQEGIDEGTDYTTAVAVLRNVESGAELNITYLLMVSIAAIVAGLGLATDSAVAVVASMLISPIMGPILGSVVGALRGDFKAFFMATCTELLSLTLCIVWGLVIAFCFAAPPVRAASRHYFWPTSEMSSRGLLGGLAIGVLIAIPSGAGVALSLLNANANSLVGVAISASLLPPAVNAGMFYGYAMVADDTLQANGTIPSNVELAVDGSISLALTGLNILCIFCTALFVFKIRDVVLGSASMEHRLQLGGGAVPLREDDSVGGWWKISTDQAVAKSPEKVPLPVVTERWRRLPRAEMLSIDSKEEEVMRACRLAAGGSFRPKDITKEDLQWDDERAELLGRVGTVKRRSEGLAFVLLYVEGKGDRWWPSEVLHITCNRGHACADIARAKDDFPQMNIPDGPVWQCDRRGGGCYGGQGKRFRCTMGCDYDLCINCFAPVVRKLQTTRSGRRAPACMEEASLQGAPLTPRGTAVDKGTAPSSADPHASGLPESGAREREGARSPPVRVLRSASHSHLGGGDDEPEDPPAALSKAGSEPSRPPPAPSVPPKSPPASAIVAPSGIPPLATPDESPGGRQEPTLPRASTFRRQSA
eukprot:TRINITY_DN4205_c0_g1_i2.p1 TRINITY_DN4205_c0_g1~~TRINITY_DN4205_c0_g1_i2.p1  ORF type:complete len:1043 (+),score=303.36 TRINITY_DN4205_c0_g1_i2:95-3130(+)